MNLLAAIVKGEVHWADALFLVAFILFVIATVIQLVRRAFEAALVPAGLAAAALAQFVL